jgi:hypothetical protein
MTYEDISRRIKHRALVKGEYPYIFHAKDHLGEYTQVFDNFFNFVFLPETAEWGAQAQNMLHTQYNCVILNNTFYFKTEADRTMFLLKFA